jgi:hypothetical protein
MNRQPIAIAKFLILGACLALGAAGCAGEPEPEPTPVAGVQHQRVTPDDIAGLSPDERLTLDLVDNRVFHFDYTTGAIDYTRVSLAVDGQLVSMEDDLATVLSWDYGTNPPLDLADAPDQRFHVARDPADFGVLTPSEVSELMQTGYFHRQTSGPPGAQPQNTDTCIYAVCVICVPPPGEPTCDYYNIPCICHYEQHVWCD